jgi:hypothetical protein
MANGRRAASAEKLIDLPLEEARAAKWRRVQQQHGPAFIGHPLEKLDEELLDAMSYAEEGALRGFPMVGMVEDLWYPARRNRGQPGRGERHSKGGEGWKSLHGFGRATAQHSDFGARSANRVGVRTGKLFIISLIGPRGKPLQTKRRCGCEANARNTGLHPHIASEVPKPTVVSNEAGENATYRFNSDHEPGES